MKKQISYFCLAIILFQSCVVYQKTPTTNLSAAVGKKEVKVITTTGRKLRFKKIEKEDTLYYGTLNNIKWHIPPAEVEAIYLKDVKKSKVLTTFAILSVPVIFGLTLFFVYKSSGLL